MLKMVGENYSYVNIKRNKLHLTSMWNFGIYPRNHMIPFHLQTLRFENYMSNKLPINSSCAISTT